MKDIPDPSAPFENAMLSLNQEHWVFVEKLCLKEQIEITPFNIARSLTFNSVVSTTRLNRALSELVTRHEGLRISVSSTSTLSENEVNSRVAEFGRTGRFTHGTFRQSLTFCFKPDLTVYEPVGGPPTAADMQMLIKAARSVNFSYSNPPLLRATLIRSLNEMDVVVLVVSHLVCDHYSLDILQSELKSLYHSDSTVRNGVPPVLPNGAMRFTRWQADHQESDSAGAGIMYWRNQWERYVSARIGYAQLVGDKREDTLTNRIVTFISESQAEPMRVFAAANGLTLNMLLLSSLYISIANHRKISAVGLMMSFRNRTRKEFENVVGWFVNSHLLAIDLSKCSTGRDVLFEARKITINATSHQEISLLYLWEKMYKAPVRIESPVHYNFRSHRATVERPREMGSAALSPEIQTEEMRPVGNAQIGKWNSPNKMGERFLIEAKDRGDCIELSFTYKHMDVTALQPLLDRWMVLSVLLASRADQPLHALCENISL